MILTSGATSVYRSIRPATADDRQGASPPAVGMATVFTGIGWAISGLVRLVHRVLKQLRTHAHGSRRNGRFHEENRKAPANRDHRSNEQPRDFGAEPSPHEIGAEQQDDDEAGEDRRSYR